MNINYLRNFTLVACDLFDNPRSAHPLKCGRMWKRMWKRFKTHVETIYTHVETIQNNLNKKVDNRPIICYLLLPTRRPGKSTDLEYLTTTSTIIAIHFMVFSQSQKFIAALSMHRNSYIL